MATARRLFPGERGGYLDIHHVRPFQRRPAVARALVVEVEPATGLTGPTVERLLAWATRPRS